ncbi:l-carnitine dehydratase bile acid-inducible f [Fusarium denticulatum]|uniref:L-carnitine dehydratase bile acid-inducible f n=1 Tax=Fusarium denticulatum TaxID=48507 RepID=A0A8H5TL53_9HYPO|nr:l-carnitine dehydratase bile acid-inducible f [Fusarium denticulatum]
MAFRVYGRVSAIRLQSCRRPTGSSLHKPIGCISQRYSSQTPVDELDPGKRSSPLKPKTRPLDGITVVSLEHAVAAPFCTRQLADLGARVIKIERPGVGDFARSYDTRVDGLASHFVWANRSKESLALDLKDTEHLKVLSAILERADVFVQNLAPGASSRLGLSYDTLKTKNEGLIVCDISGFGDSGPYRDKKSYDLLVQSEAGLLSITGTEDQAAKVGISIADISAGMYAYSNILAALMQRQKTGKGCRLDISMLESMVEWMGFPLYYTFQGAPSPKRTGASHAAIYPYGPFTAGKGETVMLGIQNEREWISFCRDVLDNPALSQDARFINNSLRVQNRDELRDIICDAFQSFSAAEVLEKLNKASIANATVNTMHDVWKHPQLSARGRWTEVDTPNGRVPALTPPGIAEPDEARMDPVPALGEHNDAILAELGMDGFKL